MPTLQAITYSVDSDELHTLFTNLLASSMDKTKQAQVHPSFVEIIKNLSPDDALLMTRSEMSLYQPIPLCDLRLHIGYIERFNHNGISFANIGTGYSIQQNILYIDETVDFNKVNLSLVNFTRLGLLNIDSEQLISGDQHYKKFSDNFEILRNRLLVDSWITARKINGQTGSVSFIPKLAEWTALGKTFFGVCVH